MGLLSSALVSACVASSTGLTDQKICMNTTEAGAKQFGIMQNVDLLEDRAIRQINREALEDFGKEPIDMVGGGIFIAKSIMEKSVTLALPTFGICNSAKTEIRQDQSLLKLQWDF